MSERDIVERLDELALLIGAPLSGGLQEQIRSHAKDEIRAAAAEIVRLRAEIVRCHDALLSIHEIAMRAACGNPQETE